MLLSEPPDLAERLLLLRRVVPFAGLPVALLGQLACEMETVTAASGSVLWEAGHPATHMLAIASGGVTVEPRGPARARRHGPGALVGLAETLGAEAYGFRLRAAGPLRALRLDGEALVDALEDDPASAVELLRALARHLRGTTP
jgi:CRP-like cAMP-binding protein